MPGAKPHFVATRFPNYDLEAQAAVQGIGVALLSPILFAELLAQGTLIAPFPAHVIGPNSYWLLWTPESADSHFVNWVKSQFVPDPEPRGVSDSPRASELPRKLGPSWSSR